MKLHWRILIALLAGVAVGGVFQTALDAPPWIGLSVQAGDGGDVVVAVEADSPAATAGLRVGDVIRGASLGQAGALSDRDVVDANRFRQEIAGAELGQVLWLGFTDERPPVPVTVRMEPGCQRAEWLRPFAFLADIFLALLKMLIVPIILTSIITGVAGVGAGKALRRMGLKTFAYYIGTSLLAVLVGQVLVNLVRPGEGAALGLAPSDEFKTVAGQSFWDVIKRMIPTNVFDAFGDNRAMLQVIFFALLFGYFVTQVAEPHRSRMKGLFEAAFEVMMKMAGWVLSLIPYGVFVLLVKVVGETGFGLFKPLGLYMAVVAGGLLFHAVITLPALLKLGGVSPLGWFKAMGPALMTAFSTSSSSMTLPVSLDTVERRGRVSNKTTSFVLPLGATINMDGTALYECVGVIFLAQYYQGVSDFPLTLGVQVQVVLMALLASVGAAGIPSAGLVMMLTILGTLGLPVEGAALLLAVDRPLDMLRTVVNVWSDSCGAALVARSEGETPLLEAGAAANTS
ncbi:MAG: cation:dicarboxylase symporter family transporter [Planctomycetota bacterium]|nr:cation:dicarboxylase symporter family transporter [Planctomycetota bacterium]